MFHVTTHDLAGDAPYNPASDFFGKPVHLTVSGQLEGELFATALGDIYTVNVFPSMEVTWGTYPDQSGHQESPGCFRCHNDEHVTADGEVISQDCFTCHTLLAMEEEEPEVLEMLQP